MVGDSLPRVQCVRVATPATCSQGFTIQLLEVSVRIPSDADCPRRF